jgi:hypothetical protein
MAPDEHHYPEEKGPVGNLNYPLPLGGMCHKAKLPTFHPQHYRRSR